MQVADFLTKSLGAQIHTKLVNIAIGDKEMKGKKLLGSRVGTGSVYMMNHITKTKTMTYMKHKH
jgi:hypothetical protein